MRSDYLNENSSVSNLNAKIVSVSSAYTLSADESGSIIDIDASTGFTLTLPAAKRGLHYKCIFKVGGTDAAMKFTVTSGDCFFGKVNVDDVNTDGEESAQQVITRATAVAAEGSYDHMLFDGDATTTGCSAGDVVDIVCFDDNAWCVDARLGTTGTAASIATIYGG